MWGGQHQYQQHWGWEEEKCIFTSTKSCVMSILYTYIPMDFIPKASCLNTYWTETLQMSPLLTPLHYQVKLWSPLAPQTWRPVCIVNISRWRFFIKLRDFTWLQFRELHYEECSRETIQMQLLSQLNVLNTEQPQETCADKAQPSESWTFVPATHIQVCSRMANLSH